MKNLLVFIWHLAVVIAVSAGEGVELLRAAADLVTRTSPRMTCESQNWVRVNFDSISVCTSGAEIVYRPHDVLRLTLLFAGEETLELAASTIGECAQLAAEAGLAAFEFNSKCLAYSSSNRFMKCYISCNRVIFVTSHSFSKKPRLVSFDEAPWVPGAYNDTREYRLEKLIYVDESNITKPYGSNQPYRPDAYRKAFSYPTLQDGSPFALKFDDVDLSTCLYYDGDAGMPILVSPVFFKHTLVIYYFMESCGDTIILPPSSTVINYVMIYSHRGYGCSEFPGKTYVNCTVNIEFDYGYIGEVRSYGLNGPDRDCDEFPFTMEKGGVKTDFCGRVYLLWGSGGRYAFTLQGSTPDTRLGFFFELYPSS